MLTGQNDQNAKSTVPALRSNMQNHGYGNSHTKSMEINIGDGNSAGDKHWQWQRCLRQGRQHRQSPQILDQRQQATASTENKVPARKTLVMTASLIAGIVPLVLNIKELSNMNAIGLCSLRFCATEP